MGKVNMNYRIVAIDNKLVSDVRKTLVSPQYTSLAAAVSVATGYGPCRSCLRVFDQGNENRIYFTYNSFDGLSELPDPGPIFIHEDTCDRYSGSSFPPDLLELPLLLEAFGEESRLVSRTPVEPSRVDAQIAEIFNLPEVSFINVRNAEAGCFVCRIEPS